MKNNKESRMLGIYVHIPFCIQKCRYCDFCSFAHLDNNVKEEYALALKTDFVRSSARFKDYVVDSIFFGGGTPTCLSAHMLGDLLKTIKSRYNVSSDAEITLECNPATAKEDDFAHLLSCGFNRLSMGLQSVHNEELSALGRIHTFDDFEYTYLSASRAGFENVNLDLMYGIPLQTEKSFLFTLEKVISLKPEHISAYALKIEPGTDFYKRRAELVLPDEDSEYNMYKLADSMLSSAGYDHYEISNYALEGKKSRHNIKYWSCDEYIGFGVAAHSLYNGVRYSNENSIKSYISNVSRSLNEHVSVEETLSEKAIAEEYVMMRLRLSDGLSPLLFEQKFGFPLDHKYIDRMNPFIKSGHIKTNEEIYALTADGMYVSNFILSEILDLNE